MGPTTIQSQTGEHGRSRRLKVIVWILLIPAAAEFIVRGPVRYLQPTNWNDLAQYYVASRLWLRGENFAKPENFVALWHDETGSTFSADTARTHIAPPPGAVVLLAPFGALPWPAAEMAWLAALLAGFAATVWSLAKTAAFRIDEPRTVAFVAGCLALAPFHTGIASANQTILIVGLCALGIWAASRRHDLAAGLLFGAACSMKPHIGAFLVLYYLIHRRWRLLITSVAFTVALVLLAAAWMLVHGVTWIPDFLNNIRFGAARNTIDDFTTANPIRFMLINLQVLLYSFTHDPKSANALALSIGAVLIAIWIVLALRSRSEDSELLALATVAVIGLLPLYHRLYDASVLAIPLCWCLSRTRNEFNHVRTGALLLMAPFLVPGTALLQQAVRQGRIPDAWAHSWWWDCLVMPHQTWLLLLLSVVLLYGMTLQASGARTGDPALTTPAL